MDKLRALYFIQIERYENPSFDKFQDVLAEKLQSYGGLTGKPECFRALAKSLYFTDTKLLGELGKAPESKRKLFNHVMDNAYFKVMEKTWYEEDKEKQGRKFDPKKPLKQGKEPPLLFIIIRSKDESTHSDVKWWGDCIRGIPTMYITYDTVFKALGTPEFKDGKLIGLSNEQVDHMIFANLW